MIMYQAYDTSGKYPITIIVSYEEEMYVCQVKMLREILSESFEPSYHPKVNMNIEDMDKSVKIVNNLIKKIKRNNS